MELFNSYEKAWVTKLFEKFAFWLGTVLILIAVLMLIVNR